MFDEEAKISRSSLVESAIAPELRVDCAVGFAPHALTRFAGWAPWTEVAGDAGTLS